MAELYYDLIKNGDRVIEQVPTKWRAQVQKMLEKDK